MNRLARRPKTRLRPGDDARLTIAVIVIGAILGVGLFATGEYVTKRRPAGSAVAAGQGNGAMYAGSTLYMPADGRTCRQRMFDNQTGQFVDKGTVDCVGAAYRGVNGAPEESASRASIISAGFRQH